MKHLFNVRLYTFIRKKLPVTYCNYDNFLLLFFFGKLIVKQLDVVVAFPNEP